MLYWNGIFKKFIPRISCLYSINLFGYNSLILLTLLSCLLHVTRKGKSLNSSHLFVTPIKLRSHMQVIRSFLMCEKLPSLLYILVSFPIFLRSCDRKFVFRFWARARCRRSVVTVVNIIAAHSIKRYLFTKPKIKLNLRCNILVQKR